MKATRYQGKIPTTVSMLPIVGRSQRLAVKLPTAAHLLVDLTGGQIVPPLEVDISLIAGVGMTVLSGLGASGIGGLEIECLPVDVEAQIT